MLQVYLLKINLLFLHLLKEEGARLFSYFFKEKAYLQDRAERHDFSSLYSLLKNEGRRKGELISKNRD